MLQKPNKTKYPPHFLVIALFCVPATMYAFSVSNFLNFFKDVGLGGEDVSVGSGSLQSLKVLEPSTFIAENIVSEDSTTLEVHREFEDDLSVGSLENHHENAIYTVQPGDSIFSISSYFGVSVETILAFNHKTSKMVHVGEVLEVPSIDGVSYKIKKGDTLAKIAKKYDISIDDVTLFNGLQDDELLAAGDEIFLPNAKETSIVKQTTTKIKGTTKNTFTKDVAISKSKTWERGDTSHLNTSAAISKYSSQPKYEGYFLFPAPGSTRTQKMHGNNGCDLAAKIGTPVLASADGVVTVAKTGGYNFGYGNYIKIKHSNGTETLYGHLSRVNVSVGESVSRGEQIGAVGSTGNSTGPHLHFEIHGAYNPFAW
jgi:LysM repeat protein